MELCFSPAEILLPRENFEKWSVIACDQYTSDPAYWERLKDFVGDAPSTLSLILPEVYLSADNGEKAEKIDRTMEQYLADGVFETFENAVIYLERTQPDGRIRRGVVGRIDLEAYDYRKGATTPVRATEETVPERIPPRVAIRRNAGLELPHVMLLCDDPAGIAIETAAAGKDRYVKAYDFDLSAGGGHIAGWLMDKAGIETLTAAFARLQQDGDGLLFCVGDGNHSLATAKACYAENPGERNRYALAEIVNIHDTALDFEPIYRVIFGGDPETVAADFIDFCGTDPAGQSITLIAGTKEKTVTVKAGAALPVGTVQRFMNAYLAGHPELTADYIHGVSETRALCRERNALGFLFEGMGKEDLFPAVRADGSLPRKTFSMGHADDKRFYLEARRLK